MCVQYMIIYTALAVCRTYQEFSGTCKGKVEAGLRDAAQTLTYGPMLCVLFIACRMRVEFLSAGKHSVGLGNAIGNRKTVASQRGYMRPGETR